MAMSEHAYFRTVDTSISKCSSSNFSIDSILGKDCEAVHLNDSLVVFPEKMELESENGSIRAEVNHYSQPTEAQMLIPNSLRALIPGQNCVTNNIYSPWFPGLKPPPLMFGLQGKQ